MRLIFLLIVTALFAVTIIIFGRFIYYFLAYLFFNTLFIY